MKPTEIIALVLLAAFACVSIAALVLASLSYIEFHGETVRFNQLQVGSLTGLNHAAIDLNASLQQNPVSVTPVNIFGNSVLLSEGLNFGNGQISAGALYNLNGLPTMGMLATTSPYVLSSANAYIDIFTGASSTHGNPNQGPILPLAFPLNSTLQVFATGNSLGSGGNIELAIDNASSTTLLSTNTATSWAFFGYIYLTSPPSELPQCYVSIFTIIGSEMNFSNSGNLSAWNVGSHINIFMTPTAANGNMVSLRSLAQILNSN